MAVTDIQQIIDNGTGVTVLPPGEYKGTFFVTHPCVIEGNGTTLWNSGESVIVVQSPGVTLKNLRVELIESNENSFSVCTTESVITEDVEIIGPVAGFDSEDNVPDMTRQIKLGKFRSGEKNTFIFELFSPSEASLNTDVQDLKVEPKILSPGINRIKITASGIPSGTFLYGDLLMKSAFTRRFYIQGSTDDEAEKITDRLMFSVSLREIERLESEKEKRLHYTESLKREQQVRNQAVPAEPPQERNRPQERSTDRTNHPQKINTASSQNGNTVHVLKRGERINIEEYKNTPLRIYMSYRALFKELDIDLYAFMLDRTGKTSCDDDFVFFGNTETESGALKFMDDKSVQVDLRKVPPHIMKISFVYSIYMPGANDNFSRVMDPFVSVMQNNREIVRYTASELFAETTIIFMEIYRHSTGWKLNTIGQGYREGLKRLCAGYGLIVS